MKTWDIAAAINYTQSNENINISDINWIEFDYKKPDYWLIICKNEYRQFIDKVLEI
jgi:hypothetical protein